MVRVLVTGGAGFLGSHLCEKLVERGDYVICLDNYFSGRHENIQHLIGKNNFEVIRHDVQNPILLEVDHVVLCHVLTCYIVYVKLYCVGSLSAG